MYPIVTKIGPFTLHTFGVMLALAILVGSTVLVRETRRLGDPQITEERMQKLIWYIVFAVVGGGRILHCIADSITLPNGLEVPGWKYYGQHPLEILAVWEGGLVMYGGLIATFLTVVIYAKRQKINILRLCDLVAPSAFLGDAIGRWGCFFAGDDYGKPTSPNAWYGIRFTSPDSLVPENLRGVKLWPTEPLMSLKALTIFVVTFWLTRRKKFDGQVAGVALSMYAVLRFMIEFVRGDADRGGVFGLSTSQFIGIFMFITGMLILILAPRRTLADELKAAEAESDPPLSKKQRKKAKAKASADVKPA
jgi:phosphatidylglycerol:prolipoprotein diacylglycerol transferase